MVQTVVSQNKSARQGDTILRNEMIFRGLSKGLTLIYKDESFFWKNFVNLEEEPFLV